MVDALEKSVGGDGHETDRARATALDLDLTGARLPRSSVANDHGDDAGILHLVGIFGEAARLSAKARLLFAGVRAGTGLTGSELMTLATIGHGRAPQTVAQLCRYLGSPRQVIQRAIKVLERERCITVTPNPDHKRAPLLRVTDKGRRMVRRADAATLQIAADLARGCDLDRAGAAHTGLISLSEHVDRALGFDAY